MWVHANGISGGVLGSDRVYRRGVGRGRLGTPSGYTENSAFDESFRFYTLLKKVQIFEPRPGGGQGVFQEGPPAETVFWKKPGAGPSTQKRGVVSGRLGPKGSGNAPAFWVEGAEIGFLCCPIWQGKLIKTQIIIFADR